jgi:hypothetical protein
MIAMLRAIMRPSLAIRDAPVCSSIFVVLAARMLLWRDYSRLAT